VAFSGGKVPGSFYAYEYNFDGVSGIACIYHSSDSAKTFSKNCYYLADFLTSVNPDPVDPNQVLSQNTPNPFFTQTAIHIHLKQADHVKLSVFDVRGREVRQLTNSAFPAGESCISWDGKSDAGFDLPAGVYFYSLFVGNTFTQTHKMILIR